MKLHLMIAAFVALAYASAAYADGDPVAGKKDFRKCRTCHTIASDTEVFFKGGKTGPNLFGVIGRAAASEDFNYSKYMLVVRQGGLIWDEALFVEYVSNPNAFLKRITGDSKARAKMTFRLADASDIAAYLASLTP